MKIACTADWHGNLPDVPECDLLLIAGDVCPNRYGNRAAEHASQYEWFVSKFLPHVNAQSSRPWLMTPGNHDFVFEADCRPQVPAVLIDGDNGMRLMNGLRFWGIPWTPPFYDWAFMAGEGVIARKLADVSCDILVSHGPPAGPLGMTNAGVQAGSTALRHAIERIQPQLVVCGHIHEGYGEQMIGATRVVNASLVDAHCRPVNPIVVVDL